MKKVRWHFILFWVALFTFWYTAPTEGYQEDFDTRLVRKLSQIMRVEAPKIIKVERLSQNEMLDEYRNFVMSECMRGSSNMRQFEYCSEVARQTTAQAFIHGVWKQKKDRTDFHIKLYERAGIDVVIHEFLHWYLHYSTEPEGIVNTHETLRPMITAILTSEEFINWLDKEGRK